MCVCVCECVTLLSMLQSRWNFSWWQQCPVTQKLKPLCRWPRGGGREGWCIYSSVWNSTPLWLPCISVRPPQHSGASNPITRQILCRVLDLAVFWVFHLKGVILRHQVWAWLAFTKKSCLKICPSLCLSDITSVRVHLDVRWIDQATSLPSGL